MYVKISQNKLYSVAENMQPDIVGEGEASCYDEAVKLILSITNGEIVDGKVVVKVVYRGEVVKVWLDPRPRENMKEFDIWAIPLL